MIEHLRHRLLGATGQRLAALCVAAAVPVTPLARELRFDDVFSDRGEPRYLHYEATFTSHGVEHRMEVWRDGRRRVRRRTDDAVEIHASRDPGATDFHLSILDLRKRIHSQIDRTNLYRIGNFTEWFDLAHGLRHPGGEYRLAEGRPPDGASKPAEACRWYELAQRGQTSWICWGARSRLPMVIQGARGEVVWRVVAVDRRPIPPSTFEIHDEGFVRNDASADIERD